jgi:Helix-turn-helix domain
MTGNHRDKRKRLFWLVVEDVLNLKQAAEKLKTSERDVRDLANRGLLKFKRKNRYNWYFKESDLQAYIDQGYGYHRRVVRKRPVDPDKELAKLQAQLVKLQARIEALQAT